MDAPGNSLFHGVVTNLRNNNNQYYADKPRGGWEEGCSKRLNPQWPNCEGAGALGGGGQVSAPHDSTWARQGRAPQYTSFFCMAH
jgi:hypothetical protein